MNTMDFSIGNSTIIAASSLALCAGVCFAYYTSVKSTNTNGSKTLSPIDRSSSYKPITKITKSTSSSTTTTTSFRPDTTDNDMKGYKITNGVKTTYFNRDLTDEDKILLGDDTPKRITTEDSNNSSSGSSSSSKANALAAAPSKWNSAGTFEENNCSQAAKKQLYNLINNTQFASDDIKIYVSNVKIDGDASIVFSRGKRKLVYDFICNAKWELLLSDDTTITGDIEITDITADQSYEFKVKVHNDKYRNHTIVEKFIKSDKPKSLGLKQTLTFKCNKFLTEFKKSESL